MAIDLLKLARVATLFAVFAAGGCWSPQDKPGLNTVGVAVTVPAQKWLVERIGRDRVTCHLLISQNQDPHTFTGTDADAARLARCRVFFTVGLPIEQTPWCRAIAQEVNLRVVPLQGDVAVSHHDHDHAAKSHAEKADGAVPSQGSTGSSTDLTEAHGDHTHTHASDHGDHSHEHDQEIHIWLSPRRLARMAQVVADTLCEIDPPHAEFYRGNLAALQAELEKLDSELKAKLAPLSGEAFFVFHPAWECFAADYGLVQVAVEKHGKDPSDQEITELQRMARQARVKVMLVQPQISSRAAQAVATAGGLELVSVNPLAEDVPTELRRVAEILVSAYRGEETPVPSQNGK